ncbi:hypothetical protein [Mycoplasmopsis gallinarum]|uniref:hypothetical protein n=1 Tax=Mycoplasmopsis gallinarum TaxID=29557 RepID=UPI00048A31E3|nr:hypothetical protein [Mycoplasmopsis gallinarum]
MTKNKILWIIFFVFLLMVSIIIPIGIGRNPFFIGNDHLILYIVVKALCSIIFIVLIGYLLWLKPVNVGYIIFTFLGVLLLLIPESIRAIYLLTESLVWLSVYSIISILLIVVAFICVIFWIKNNLKSENKYQAKQIPVQRNE